MNGGRLVSEPAIQSVSQSASQPVAIEVISEGNPFERGWRWSFVRFTETKWAAMTARGAITYQANNKSNLAEVASQDFTQTH